MLKKNVSVRIGKYTLNKGKRQAIEYENTFRHTCLMKD